MDVVQVVATVLIGIIIGGLTGGLTSWFAFRLKFERFASMDEQREEDWTKWRASVDRRLDSHSDALKSAGDFSFRIKRLEAKVNGFNHD